MNKQSMRRSGSWLIPAGGLLLGICTADQQVEKLIPNTLPANWSPVLFLVGILAIAAGVLLWLLSFVNKPFTWRDYEVRKAKVKDLKLIHEFAKDILGDISPLETMTEWHKKNSSVFFVMITEKIRSTERNQRVVGYYCFLPLVQNGVDKIITGEVRGHEIPVDYIARMRKECVAIYIGGIAAKDRMSKAALLATLNHKYPTFKKWADTVYTRPVTSDGVRIATKKGFTALDQANQGKRDVIYRLKLN